MSTYETPDHFSSTTSWRARVRFVRDLAPKGMGVFMAPHRSMVLRLSEKLYRHTPLMLAVVAVAWGAIALSLWPEVPSLGLFMWSALVAAAWGALVAQWRRSVRPMLRPGSEPAWAFEHVSNLWLLNLALASGIVLIFPEASLTHQRALCFILVSAGVFSAVLSSSSVRAIAAVLGPSIGVVAGALIVRGSLGLAAAVALAGGIAVLATLGLHQLAAESVRRDVEAA